MPNKNKNAAELTVDNRAEVNEDAVALAQKLGVPIVSGGVNRRMNLGNYEHLDIFNALTMPAGADIEEWRDDILSTINDVMSVVSQETNRRVQIVKEAQNDGRPSKPEVT